MAVAALSVTGGLVLATVGWYFRVATYQGEPKGGEARITFASACDTDAATVIAARLSDFGLPATPLPPEAPGTFGFTTALPGQPDDLAHLPGVLAARGELEVRVAGVVHPVHITDVGVQLAFSGTPVTLVLLEQPLPQEGVEVRVDGELAEIEALNGTELQIAARAGQSTEALRLATDRAVDLRHPLPCPVTVVSAMPVGGQTSPASSPTAPPAAPPAPGDAGAPPR
jgi:hypothetical protein